MRSLDIWKVRDFFNDFYFKNYYVHIESLYSYKNLILTIIKPSK